MAAARYPQSFSFSDEEEDEDEDELDGHADYETRQELQLIENTNKLLAATGIVTKRILSIAELARVASSIFVAIYESVYHTRIDEVIRNPISREDYEFNAQLVVDRLSEHINSDLPHITGPLIVNGDTTALRNLVNIFMRIMTVTSQGVHSTSTIESAESWGDELARDRKRHSFTNTSLGSISTKDSQLPRKHSKHVSSPLRPHPSRQSHLSPSKSPSGAVRSKYDDAVHASLEKAEGFLKKELQLHQASLRRQNAKLWQQAKLRRENERRGAASQRALQGRQLHEMGQAEKAFRLQSDSEESVLLRKVYQALLRETLRFRAEEKSQERAFVKAKERELQGQLESLQRIFRERVDAYRTQGESPPPQSNDALRHGRSALLGLETRYNQLLEREKAWREQCRDRELRTKRRGYKDLLALLKAEDWADSLRGGH